MDTPLLNSENDALANEKKACRWRTALALLAVLLLAEWLLYRQTLMSMALIWARSDTFMHGFLVPPISLWLIWRQRGVLAGMEPSPNPWFALAIAACGFVWLLGQMAAVAPLAQLASIGTLGLTVAALLGARIFLVMGFPLAFLLFAVPFGECFMPQFMRWTADFTVMGLRLSGVPVYREGLQLTLPSGSWSVAEACSGVRYLIASMMLGTLFAYLTYRTLRRRLIFIAISLSAPIVANWLRAYMIVMLDHFSGNTLATGVDHLIYGWLFFGIVILIVFAIGSRWREDGLPESANEPEKLRPGIGAGIETYRRKLLTASLASAVLAAFGPFAQWRSERHVQPGPIRLAALSPVPGWTSGEKNMPDLPEWTPQFTTASALVRQSYAKNGRMVGLFLAYYRNQGENRKLVSSDNALVKSSAHDWKKMAEGVTTALIQGTSLDVRTGELLSASGNRLSVWQWYWIDGRWTSNDYLAKAYTAFHRLSGQGDDSAVVIVYTVKGETGESNAVLRDFTNSAASAIENVLQRTRHGDE